VTLSVSLQVGILLVANQPFTLSGMLTTPPLIVSSIVVSGDDLKAPQHSAQLSRRAGTVASVNAS
jgi:hypothetical protein